MDPTNLANQPGLPSAQESSETVPAETPAIPSSSFVQSRLPWLIAAGALLVYAFTLPHWMTFLGLPPLSRAAGWDWHPTLLTPVEFLVTYPIRWLPSSWHLIALNLLAATCATMALALLARSVALLPHDRTRDQRQSTRGNHAFLTISTAWMPPLLAALVCGLQLTFWEHAVVWTGEALDLVIFAYIVRCLLEYRIDQRDSWLWRMALVYGLGATNNFALIAFLPAATISVLWIKGLSVLKYRFFVPLLLCGLAGLSLYLLLPTVQSISGLQDVSFWQMLRLNLGYQKHTILSVRRVVVLMLSFTSVLPILFIGIKWPDSFGDISAAGNALTNLMSHVMHGVFLIFCLCVAFDPAFSARRLAAPFNFLPFYYLGALSIGYCAGYFLLVFGAGPVRVWQRASGLRKAINWAIVGLVWAAAIAVPAGLAYKNLPLLKSNLGPGLSQYARLAARSLPARDAVVLSDQPLLLFAVYGALQESGQKNKILVETSALPIPTYHRVLAKRFPQRWPALPPSHSPYAPVDGSYQVQLLTQLEQAGPLYYLQPSYGYYFERFFLKPRHLIYEMKACPTNSLAGPALSAEEIKENMAFWQEMKTGELKPLLQSLKPSKVKKSIGYNGLLGGYYARALDYLGVELQKGGDLSGAGDCFALALDFNPESPAALLNQEYNKKLPTHPEVLKRSDEVMKRLSFYGGHWDILLGWHGPIDEPGFRNELAVILAKGRDYRQAADHLLRIATLTPTNIDARVGLADMCLKAGMIDLALKYVADVRASVPSLQTADREGLLRTEAWAYNYRSDFPTAERILLEEQAKYPLNDMAYFTLSEMHLRAGRITNSMEVLRKELKAQPENGTALNNYARLKILNNELPEAIKLLDQALTLDPKNSLVLLNRAICNLRSGKLEEAQRDYQSLETTLPKVPYSIYFGLFDIAYKKKNPKTAAKYAELYLKAAPRGTAESKDVTERAKKAKSGSL